MLYELSLQHSFDATYPYPHVGIGILESQSQKNNDDRIRGTEMRHSGMTC